MQAWVRFAAVLLLVLSLGLHRALLQGVAWTGMIINYSRDGSFTQALARTFDGKHPCCLCKAIKQGRADEQKHQPQQVNPGGKLDVGLVWQPTSFDFTGDRPRIAAASLHASSRAEEPPKPRPRAQSTDRLAPIPA